MLQQLMSVLDQQRTALDAKLSEQSVALEACEEQVHHLVARRWELFQNAVAQEEEGRMLRSTAAGQDRVVTALMCHVADLTEQLRSLGAEPLPPRFPIANGWAMGTAGAPMLDLSS